MCAERVPVYPRSYGLLKTKELYSLVGSQILLMGQSLIKPPLIERPSSAVSEFLVYNTGDFGNGYANTFFVDYALKYISRNKLNPRLRMLVSGFAGGGSVVVAETTKLIPWNYPDVSDIPAGLLGAAACLGVSIWANRQKPNSISSTLS